LSERSLLRVGLTGGIASGKTTVGNRLAELGAFIIDADGLSHLLMEPGRAAYEAVISAFGQSILSSDDRISRPELGRIVFGDPSARRRLQEIVHPLVMAESERLIQDYAASGNGRVVIFDAALLVESGLYREFHKLIVTSCSRNTQIRRILARDGLTTDEAEARIDAQQPLATKLAVADYVIDTEGTVRETLRQVEATFASLLQDHSERFAG
jgi:dephospho-CoA kinase